MKNCYSLFSFILFLCVCIFMVKARLKIKGTCSCTNCLPQKFPCDMSLEKDSEVGGCDCKNCRCSEEVVSANTCCKKFDHSWFAKDYKCWRCDRSKYCSFKSCGCKVSSVDPFVEDLLEQDN